MHKRSPLIEDDDIDDMIDLIDGKEGRDKRKAERKDTKIQVHFMIMNLQGELIRDVSKKDHGVIVDISSSGVGLSSKTPLYTNENYFIKSVRNDLNLQAEVRVVYFKKDGEIFRYGCIFQKILKAQKS